MKKIVLSFLKYLILPFALLYGFIVFLRNKLYDWNVISSIEFNVPVICVGNITVGGTGKSPHIEYLIDLLAPFYKVATLSRGYRRHTTGFIIAHENTNAREIGDEPFQFKSKYPQITVAVAEERMTAIPLLLQNRPETEIVLLDDAFQHRTVRAGLNILLTDYDRLYTRDYIMPFGLLRENKSGAKRAEIIIVSKCPLDMSLEEKKALTTEIQPLPQQQLYFSGIRYKNIYPLSSIVPTINADTQVVLVTGIANAAPLIKHLQNDFADVFHLEFKDHHYYTYDDLKEIQEAFSNMPTTNKILVTTEKDASRLMLLQDKILEYQLPFFAQAIGVEILFDEDAQFNTEIRNFVYGYIPPILEEVSEIEV
nr:tetraacyldisaccharide 4'-kinase [Chitinophagaceae bacterium]